LSEALTKKAKEVKPDLVVSVVHGLGLEPLIEIHDANQVGAVHIELDLAGAQELFDRLLNGIEMVEGMMAGAGDVRH